MQIVRRYRTLPSEVRGAVVAVGNFDGVHLGHRQVIGEAGRLARAEDRPWAVLTFEPHPRDLFRPDDPPYRLTPRRPKMREIHALGVDLLVVLRFSKAFSMLGAEEFVHDVLVDGLAASHVVCGYDFKFGHGRKGDPGLLLRMGKEQGFDFTCVSQVGDDGGVTLSSTRVRKCLRNGDPRGAAAVLGRPFEIEGRVVGGDRRGRTIGFPTINLPLRDYLRPMAGVYAVRAGFEEGDGVVWYDGVANLGVRPTFGEGEMGLEAHLFGVDADLYGRRARVALVDFIRPERKFEGINALKAQISADCDRARALLGRC